jgi:hypothetical protein
MSQDQDLSTFIPLMSSSKRFEEKLVAHEKANTSRLDFPAA